MYSKAHYDRRRQPDEGIPVINTVEPVCTTGRSFVLRSPGTLVRGTSRYRRNGTAGPSHQY